MGVDDEELRRALERQAARELEFTLKVAVLLGLELTRKEVARTLKASAREVNAAVERLRRIAPAVGRDVDPQ